MRNSQVFIEKVMNCVYQIEKEKKEEVKEKKILTCKDGKRLNKCSGIG